MPKKKKKVSGSNVNKNIPKPKHVSGGAEGYFLPMKNGKIDWSKIDLNTVPPFWLDMPEDSWQQLSSSQKKELYTTYKDYDPGDKAVAITKTEKDILKEQAKKMYEDYYGKKIDEVAQDYELTLSDQIDTITTGIKRNQQDLLKAIEEGDDFKAEQLRIRSKNLQQTLGDLQKDRDTAVTRKRQYLETQIAQIKEDLKTGLTRTGEDLTTLKKRLGITSVRLTEDEKKQIEDLKMQSTRLSEDETRSLQNTMKEYDKSLTNLQENMASRGFVWSGRRKEGEKELKTGMEDIVSYTKTTAKRGQEDIATNMANAEINLKRGLEDLGLTAEEATTEAARRRQDLMSAASRGTDELNLVTQQEIDDIMSQYGRTRKSELQAAEQYLGTENIKRMLGGQTAGLYGGLEGSINKSTRQEEEANKLTVQRGLEDFATAFIKEYGYNEFMNKFSTSGYGNYKLPSTLSPYATTGTQTLAKERTTVDYEQEQRDMEQQTYQLLLQNRRQAVNPYQ